MAAGDVVPLTDAIAADHWGERRSWFEFVVGHPACRPLVAEDGDGRRLGSAVATVNGPVAWIGTIWVVPDRRREGIGERLTEAVLDVAGDAGCRTSVLVATEVGRPLYEKLGFELQTSIVVVEAPGTGADASGVAAGGPPDPRVRPFRPDDLEAMARARPRRDRRGPTAPAASRSRPRRRPPSSRTRPTGSAASWSGRPGAAGRPSPRTRTSPWRSSRRDGAGPVPIGTSGPASWPRTHRDSSRLARRGLDRGMAGAPPRPGSPARLAARRHLGPVQPRPRLGVARTHRTPG